MTNGPDLRKALREARTTRDTAAAQFSEQREELKNLQRRITTLERSDVRKGAQQEKLAALKKQATELSDRVARQRGDVKTLKENANRLLNQWAILADPEKQVAALNDAIPILFFPVRLEVRFQRRTIERENRPELWVRVFPDDCQIDTFEALLTDSELDNLTSFWTAMWRAGKVEAQERGAWRALLGGSSSGRAAYMIGQFQPANPGDKPTKTAPQDVVLVIVPQIDVTPAEQAAAFTYWTDFWKADGDTAKQQTALSALKTAVGNARASQLISGFVPDPNGWDPPKPSKRSDVAVTCAVLKLPPRPTSKQSSWTQAPKIALQPDRFVALLYAGGALVSTMIGNPIPDGLATGPDPSLPQDEQITVANDDLQLNDDLAWLADFNRAVAVGMGFRIPLTPAQAQQGFDRIVVVGIRLSSDEKESKSLLESLIANQSASKGGYSLVPQGSPTNNTSSDGSAYTWVDDPDSSYDRVFKGKDAYVESDDPLKRRDGQWLAEALGIDDSLVKQISNAAGVDQIEARAMNMAMWNGTLGYMFEEMLTPLFSRADIAATRLFFTRYVSGRGPLPAVRVGRQPYGVLPVTSFASYQSTPAREPIRGVAALPALTSSYLDRLHRLLLRMDADWMTMSSDVSRVGQAGDPHQILLDVVGLHSGAVEYHQRYAESFDQLYNKLVLDLGQFFGGILAGWLRERSQILLASLGADPTAEPPILEKFFYGESALLGGPLVDDSPLSESKAIRPYTPDKKNYLEWLATASLDVIRTQDFGGNPQPTALLYLMLRHSMMLGQWDAGLRFLETHSLVDPRVERLEPSFINVQAAANTGTSKFRHLYKKQPVVTGNDTQTLAEYVLSPTVLTTAVETEDLREIVAALNLLAKTPTARLERVFAEHVDTCSYRLDSWKTAITATRLAEMRRSVGEKPTTGIYLGAYGWLENLRPKTTALQTPQLGVDAAKTFERPGDAPLEYDPQNAGYIHAPSLSQAAAAAVLKNAYRMNATPATPDTMAVNISSNRVRQAQTILEGIRNGQTLSALLGYRFERGLHDEHNLAEVDKFIFPLRLIFPLVANQLQTTADSNTDITLLEARNVLDGVKLVNRLRTPGNATYPFGIPLGTGPGQVPTASGPEAAAINLEADKLLDLYDALGDLAMAESVYQVVLGNFDRSSAVMNAFSNGGIPPELEVIKTARIGLSLNHRVSLHLDSSVNPAVSPSLVPMTPRAKAEAPLNDWLGKRLPAPATVAVSVTYTTPALLAPKTVTLTQQDLGLQPIDLLYLLNLDLDQAMSEIDDRIVELIRFGPDAHPDIAVTINYTQPVAGTSFFELAALVRSLREIVLKSRAVGPTDMSMPLENKAGDSVWDEAELTGRVQAAIAALTPRRDALVALEADASDLDAYAALVSAEFLKTAFFGLPQTGTGQIHGDIRAIYDAIVQKIQEIVTRWTGKRDDYAALLFTYPGLTSDDDRFTLLRQAERLISSAVTAVPPADPNVYKAAIAVRKGQFDTHLAQFQALLKFAGTKLVDFAAAADAMSPIAATHDITPFEIEDQKAAIVTLRQTIVARVTSLADDLTARITTATTTVAALPGDGSEASVQQLLAAARQVLGSELQLVPRFRLASDRAAEFQNAWNGSNALLTDLLAAGRRFPVDDWLYGLARVRTKLSAWEEMMVLSEALGRSPTELTPVQLPFASGDRWMALEFDTASAAPGNRLLYTAHFAAPFDPSVDQCGLVVDEWPELVPAPDLLSGLAFHFDRPNSQPPQTMLLAVPPVLRGSWNWKDIVTMINGALDDAKKRGVEPALVDNSNYAQFLPATLMAVTLYQITVATNLALNNRVYDFVRSS